MKYQTPDLPKGKSVYTYIKNNRNASEFGFTSQANTKKNNEFYLGFSTEKGDPFLYWDKSCIELSGVCNYNYRIQTGIFIHKTKDGILTISNVHSYHVFGAVYPGMINLFTCSHIPEESATRDIYVSAIVLNNGIYDLQIYHNTALIYTMKNVYHKEYSGYNDPGMYKHRHPYVRFSVRQGGLYKNYMYSFEKESVYELDDSIGIPSFDINYDNRTFKWENHKHVITESGDSISIDINLDNSKSSAVIREYIRDHAEYEYLPNLFDDDQTVNIRLPNVKDPEAIRFIYYCASINIDILGDAIMKIPIDKLEIGTLNYRFECHAMLSDNFNIHYYKALAKELYARLEEAPQINQLPQQIYRRYIGGKSMASYMYHFLTYYCSNAYAVDSIVSYSPSKNLYSYDKERDIYTMYFNKAVNDGTYSNRWKGERAMYDLIHRRFPDAIYQYHSGWLGHQSLDVYVPSIATAFEYQGIQHYKAIEFFGGEIGFKKRLILDKNKTDLCNRNGISLVEWKYDEPVTTISLDKKLTHCSQSPIDH